MKCSRSSGKKRTETRVSANAGSRALLADSIASCWRGGQQKTGVWPDGREQVGGGAVCEIMLLALALRECPWQLTPRTLDQCLTMCNVPNAGAAIARCKYDLIAARRELNGIHPTVVNSERYDWVI